MNLTDLQVELRSMEERLSVLQREVEGMKPKTEDEKRAQFAEITKLALKSPLRNPQVSAASEGSRNKYIQSLSYLLLSSESEMSGKLLYLSRLAAGCGENLTAEEIYKAGLEIQTEDFDEICADLQNLKYPFLVDAMVMANMSVETPEKDFAVVADIAGIFGCGKEEVCILSWIARAVLACDWDVLDHIPAAPQSIRKISGDVIKMLPREWIRAHRRECGRVCVECKMKNLYSGYAGFVAFMSDSFSDAKRNKTTIKMRQQARTIVKENDILVQYEIVKNGITEEKELLAPCDGVVFFIEDEEDGKDEERTYLVVYVVSYFDDYEDFVEWYKTARKEH